MLRIAYKHYRVEEEPEMPKSGIPEPYMLRSYWRGHKDFVPYPRGGKTICIIYDDETSILVRGEATCSMSDLFCYKTGREIAFTRAMIAYNRALNEYARKKLREISKEEKNLSGEVCQQNSNETLSKL